MAWISTSERDLRRIEVLSDVRAGRRTVASAAAVLAVSERQAYRLLARYEADGGGGLIHKARGRISNRSRNEGIRKYAVELVKTRYVDFGPTLATEALLDKHQLRIGKETLRRWMMAEGLWLSRTQRRSFHQPRLRRESYGELIQIDGSDHRWFATEVRWRDVRLGAFLTALMFTLGKTLMARYLGHSVGSPYGAAGSLVVVTAWVYYSAQIFFLGAEFTRAFSLWRDVD